VLPLRSAQRCGPCAEMLDTFPAGGGKIVIFSSRIIYS